jgi:integrase
MIADLKQRPLSWVFENVYRPAHAAKLQPSGVAATADAVESFITLVGRDPTIEEITPQSLKQFQQFTRSQGYSYHVAKMRRERVEAIRDYAFPRPLDVTKAPVVVGTLRQYVAVELPKLVPARAHAVAILAARSLCRFLSRDVPLDELTPEMILAFESSLPPAAGEKYASALRRVMRTVDPVKFRKRGGGRPASINPESGSPWLLQNLFEQEYEPRKLRPRSENMKRLYRCTLRVFEKFLGRYATLDDFRDETVNNFAAWRLRQGWTKNTVNRDLWNLLAFWRWCHDKGYVEHRPDVPIEVAPHRVPEAWTAAELRKLYRTIDQLPGNVGLVPASDFWRALLLVLWDSAERIGAVVALEWPNIDLRRKWVRFPAETRKGGRDDSAVRLSDDAVAALRKIRAKEGPVFPWPWSPTYLWHRYGSILRRAGLPDDRMSKFHRIRKSVASHVEAAGGNATIMLRHSDRRVTEKYIDPRISKRQQPVDILFPLTEK